MRPSTWRPASRAWPTWSSGRRRTARTASSTTRARPCPGDALAEPPRLSLTLQLSQAFALAHRLPPRLLKAGEIGLLPRPVRDPVPGFGPAGERRTEQVWAGARPEVGAAT